MGFPNQQPDVDTENEDSPFITNGKDHKGRQYPSPWYALPWLLVFIFASLFIKERALQWRVSTPLGTFASGFATEFGKLAQPNLNHQ